MLTVKTKKPSTKKRKPSTAAPVPTTSVREKRPFAETSAGRFVMLIVIILVVLVVVKLAQSDMDDKQTNWAWAIVLALLCGGFAAFLPGSMKAKLPPAVTATGAVGVFLFILYSLLSVPDKIPNSTPAPREAPPTVALETVPPMSTNPSTESSEAPAKELPLPVPAEAEYVISGEMKLDKSRMIEAPSIRIMKGSKIFVDSNDLVLVARNGITVEDDVLFESAAREGTAGTNGRAGANASNHGQDGGRGGDGGDGGNGASSGNVCLVTSALHMGTSVGFRLIGGSGGKGGDGGPGGNGGRASAAAFGGVNAGHGGDGGNGGAGGKGGNAGQLVIFAAQKNGDEALYTGKGGLEGPGGNAGAPGQGGGHNTSALGRRNAGPQGRPGNPGVPGQAGTDEANPIVRTGATYDDVLKLYQEYSSSNR